MPRRPLVSIPPWHSCPWHSAADVVEHRDMATIVRDRVQEMVKKGMTLAQVKDAKPTLDYDPLYGQANRATDRFVESVYKSLSAKK
jgi:cyclase